MLSLGRHVGQTLLIGRDIRITIVSVSGRQVRLAIEAPADVRILRDELVQVDDGLVDLEKTIID